MTTLDDKDFELSMQIVFERECPGGDTKRCYGTVADDPGGETNMGISKRQYPNEDIKNLTVERAKQLYYKDYWLKFGCEKLRWPMNLLLFDTSVNMHPTIVEGLRSSSKDWMDFLLRRIYQYALIAMKKKNGRYPMLKFLPGWIVRVYRVYRYMRTKTEELVTK